MNLLPVLTTTEATGLFSSGTVGLILYMAAIILIFYFLFVRPQKKQQKAHDTLLTTIAAGDSVLTSSGFYGVIIDVMEEVVIVEFGNNKNCRIPMKKDAIVEVEKAGSETEE